MPLNSHSIKWGARSSSPVENDFYATPDEAIIPLFELIPPVGDCLEPCNGSNAIGKYLPTDSTVKMDIDPKMTADIYADFLTFDFREMKFDLTVTNPPFNLNADCRWVKKCLDLLKPGGTCALFQKLLWLETPTRTEFCRQFPPKIIYVFGDRVEINGGNGICYAWFVWKQGIKSETVLKWIYPKYDPVDPRAGKLAKKVLKASKLTLQT